MKNIKLKEAWVGWDGRSGCYCSDCWKYENKGTYNEWLKLYKNWIKLIQENHIYKKKLN